MVQHGDDYNLDTIANCVTLNMADPSHMQRFFEDGMWNYLPALAGVFIVSDLKAPVNLFLQATLAAVQTLADKSNFPRVVLFTQGDADLNGFALRGFVRTLRKEQPQFKAMTVDVDAFSHDDACAEFFPGGDHKISTVVPLV